MNTEAFQSWLTAYGAAWEDCDPEAYMPLFSEDAAYHWTPFEAPRKGHAEIREALSRAMETQKDPDFSFEIISFDGKTGWAHWTCSFTRKSIDEPVRIDGVLCAEFDEAGKCRVFREWWHALEPGQGDLMRDFDA
ncbi:nuclear transport factor 2 family protein [Henriciella aquimarina]|uniref:nuclear transport factor 2 family protein n=1 Tax=Henriciella aquimarina TaxID=545261 RepID=UPI000A07261D|nr:nuclear transport factor 2 family protein [Henriciella aquimarina]